MTRLWLAAFLLCFSAAPMRAGQADELPTVHLSPQTIEMATFYNGARVRIEGVVPRGTQVMVIVRGSAKDEVFNRKGRVGPIWINVDKVHVTGTPSLFLRFSSVDVHSLLPRPVIDRYGLDELSIKERMQVRTSRGEPDAEYRELIENSYIELKKKDGTYRRVADRVHMAEQNGKLHYWLEFNWPKSAPPGKYGLEVYAVRPGAVVGQAATVLTLVEVGFPAFMVMLAHTHPWWYGMLAVLAAVIAGFGIDAIASRLLKPRKAAPPQAPKAPAPPLPKEAPEVAAAREPDHAARN